MLNRNVRGILGTKLGMTQVWDANNRVIPVTVIKAGPNVVTQVKTADRDGYTAVQLGFGDVDPRKVTKPQRGHFAQSGVTPRRHVAELRTADAGSYQPGQEILADVFAPGTVVDVTGVSKGKGFAGVMKRHGFKGLGAGHGVERKHRSPGSVGGCATPGRVFKGLRMAGRMGHAQTTVACLKVHAVDTERGYLLIKGAVPGPDGGVLFVRSAAKRPAPEASQPATQPAGADASPAQEVSA
jgi:large subunit ribosomal protein L3